jgi:hypothetical protein
VRTFQDRAGRTWSLSVNVDAVKRVRSLLSVDLLELGEGKLLEKIAADDVMLVDIIYVLVKPEADAQKVTDVDFGRAMAGDAIDAAWKAFLEELSDFFRSPAKRRVLRKALVKLEALEEKVMAAAEKRLDGPELDEALDDALRTSGSSSGSSPA